MESPAEESPLLRRSGIPRPSRLPLLRPATNQASAANQLRPVASAEKLRSVSPGRTFAKPSIPSSRSRTSARPSVPTTPAPNTVPSSNKGERLAKDAVSAARTLPQNVRKPQAPAAPASRALPKRDHDENKDSLHRLSERPVQKQEPDVSSPGHEAPPELPYPKTRTARPSLSDRTIESLSKVPPSPRPRRRESSFFSPKSPMGPPSRPASSMSVTRRPGTSDGTPKTGSGPAYTGVLNTASRNLRSLFYNDGGNGTPSTAQADPERSPSRKSVHPDLSSRPNLTGSKTMFVRSAKPRPSLGMAFAESNTSKSRATPSTSSRKTSATKAKEVSPETGRKVSNSSAALREQIAQAKAARRSLSKNYQIVEKPSKPTPALNFDLAVDPFNQAPPTSQSLLRKRLDAARTDGRLNIAAMGLQEIPSEVLNMYDPEALASNGAAWSECVDLVRFVAADNEISAIGEDFFPDVDNETAIEEESKGLIFRGIEFLDLHGNQLNYLPPGLRRLEHLTSLNLSRNKLDNDAMAIISQVKNVRDLKLAETQLEGQLPESVGRLTKLETFDLQHNKIQRLPDCLQELVNLRVLNVGDNALEALPTGSLAALPLVELVVSKNKLKGVAFATDYVFPRLQTLDVANNALLSLTGANKISMPALKTLDISNNRISHLPDVSALKQLLTLLAADNKLSGLPEGFAKLQKLKRVDFTGNGFVKIDESIALMESLETFLIAANPLRDRKLLTMTSDDLLRELRSRVEPVSEPEEIRNEASADEDDWHDARADYPAWTMKQSGVLDLSSSGLSELEPEFFKGIVDNNDIRQVTLTHNSFQALPLSLSMAPTIHTLDLSHNDIASALSTPLSLPGLRELRLTSNKLTSFDPLTTYLSAPSLEQLDVSINRISGSLPALRSHFPELTMLLAFDNRIADVFAESLKGLKRVDISRNEIGHLPPRIGLLSDTLTSLGVEGNRFRVPSHRVLEKGTQALLTWLRNRLPASEGLAEELE